MPEITLTIESEHGLHARPAALFVQTAKQFRSEIRVIHGAKEGNAKSILTVLALGVERGSVVTLRAEGEDAVPALEALKGLVLTEPEPEVKP